MSFVGRKSDRRYGWDDYVSWADDERREIIEEIAYDITPAPSIQHHILARIDRLIAEQVFSSRSQAIEAAVKERIERLDHWRLGRECAKLDRNFSFSPGKMVLLSGEMRVDSAQ